MFSLYVYFVFLVSIFFNLFIVFDRLTLLIALISAICLNKNIIAWCYISILSWVEKESYLISRMKIAYIDPIDKIRNEEMRWEQPR